MLNWQEQIQETKRVNIQELKDLAEKATPGPWWTWSGGVYSGSPEMVTPSMIRGHHITICEGLDLDGEDDASGNQAFIAAANPSAVLELIAQRDELLEALVDCRENAGTPEAVYQRARDAISRCEASQ